MKKIFSIISMLLCLAANVNAQTTWDFSAALPDADKTALDADKETWSYISDKDRYESLKKFSGELTANGQVLQLTKGLTFSGEAKKIRIDVAKRVQLAGKNVSITIPNLKMGQTVTVSCASTGDNATTLDSQVNLSNTEGFVAADKNTTQTGTGTVTADGDVVLSSTTGSMNVFSITVSAPAEAGDDPTPETPTADMHDVALDLKQNQMQLTLASGDIKYYNTNSLQSVDINDGTVTVNPTGVTTGDVYNGNVNTIGFAKKSEEGESGQIENPDGVVEITEAKGWLESAYVKWKPFTGADSYNVYIKGGNHSSYTKIDEQLVRNYGTYGRADMVGLIAGTDYSIKVIPTASGTEMTANANEATNLTVKNYDRSGFAHKGVTSLGAYNNDGSLKAGATVIYVTNNNFNTVKATVRGQEFTGLGEILYGKQKGTDSTPIAVRVIGELNVSKIDASQLKSDEDGLQLKCDKDVDLNVTIEGIGDDACFNGFGMTFYKGKSVEMRNLGLVNFNDDGVQLKTVGHGWIHHNDFFYGNAGSAADQAKGDGSLDVKDDSQYCTFSYNHFWDSGKTSLCGMKSESGPNYLCYHHNWFDHSDSRHPRVRTMSVHVWNNYYDGVSKIGVGAVKGANVFVEANYFRNSKNPMLISEQGTDGRDGFADDHDGGMIKAYGNVLTEKSLATFIPHTKSATEFDAYVATSRDEQVPSTYKSAVGNYTYDNFDTNSSVMYTYTPDAAADVPAVVTGWYGAGRLNHGDLQFTFSSADDTSDAVNNTLKNAVVNYSSTLVGIYGDENATSGESGSTGGTGTEGDNTGGEETGGGETGGTTITAEVECTFDKDGKPSNNLFTVVGNGSDSKGEVVVNGTTISTCLKLESSTSITFTIEQPMTLTLIFGSSETPSAKIDGNSLSSSQINGNVATVSLATGKHVITKDKSRNLFYIALKGE